MHKLFVLSHLRTLARLNALEFTPAAWEEVATKNTLAPSGDAMLFRLPREQLKHALNIHCPINSVEQPHANAIILAGKALRHHVKIDEAKHCAKCPFVQQCAHAKKQHVPSENDNSLRDLLYFFYGLQHLMKPESIYYRQWVSMYRLGDSIIASIDDLSKGGLQIAEYDRLRLQGIKAFEERNVLKNKDKPKTQSPVVENEGQAKDFEATMKKLESINEEKSKPKQKKSQKAERAQRNEQESLGRDFSFDQEAEFEPVQKFTKNSEKPAAFQGQKGYQKIQRDEGKPGKTQNKQYNKFRPQKEPIENFEDEFMRYQPRGENRKPYERNEREDREDRGQRKPKYDKFDRNDRFDRNNRGDSRGRYERGQQWGESRGGERQFRSQKQQRYGGDQNYGNKYNNDRKGEQSYKQKSRDQRQDFPRIKEMNRNAPRDNRQRDQQEQYSSKSAPNAKPNPFVSKWKPQEEDLQPRAAPSRKIEEPASRPKIIQMENIDESTEEGTTRSGPGRRGRSRR